MCMTGCEEVEMAQHLFLSCSIFRELWPLVRAWIGVFGDDPLDIRDHFHQFIYLSGGSAIMQLLWLLCVWVIWSERNNRLFQNKVTNMHQLFEKRKIHSYWWMKVVNIVYMLGGSQLACMPSRLLTHLMVTMLTYFCWYI